MSKEDFQVIPENERKCIWMSSGVVSYKLCPGNYSCEECMFDRVMRNEMSAMIRRPDVDAALASDIVSTESVALRIDGSLFYHSNHCWVRVIRPDEVVIGINGILARVIYGVNTVVLPVEGDEIKSGECFAHIIQEKHIVPLILPVNGVITSINSDLLKEPELLKSDFNGNGWLVRVRPDNLEHDLKLLYFGNSAIEWYRKKERSISEAIHAIYSVKGAELGETMMDGGEFILNPTGELTPDQYYNILEILSSVE